MPLNSIIDQLQRGKRYWPAELVLRAVGLVMLGFCALMVRIVYRMSNEPPPHYGTPLELVIAAVAVIALWAGLALTFAGPGLFRLVPKPPSPQF